MVRIGAIKDGSCRSTEAIGCGDRRAVWKMFDRLCVVRISTVQKNRCMWQEQAGVVAEGLPEGHVAGLWMARIGATRDGS